MYLHHDVTSIGPDTYEKYYNLAMLLYPWMTNAGYHWNGCISRVLDRFYSKPESDWWCYGEDCAGEIPEEEEI